MKRKSHAMILSAALAAAAVPSAKAAVLISDSFSYADGALETVSGGVWEINSGTGSKLVSSGKLVIDDNNTSDYQRQFNAGATATTVYASFKANFSSTDPPSSVGSYFAALAGPKSGTSFSTAFRARVGTFVAGTEGAGKFTLGISSGGNAVNIATDFTYWPTALSFDTEYTIAIEYDATSPGTNKLWVNPTAESDPSITFNGGSGTTLGSFLWRVNSSSIDGDKTVDDLNVGTTFGDVIAVPEPTVAGLAAAAGVAAMLKRRKR